MSVRIELASEAVIHADDRGFNYGDGLFETILVRAAQPVWWDAHWARLQRGASVLGIDCPAADAILAAAQPLLRVHRDGILKMVLERGSGGRGYALPEQPQPILLLSWHPLPAPAPRPGLCLRWCQLRLGIQPRLAGLKHCNRLEQVLARAEWCDPRVHEGLLCDALGAVTGAISGNLFVRIEGRWLTPPVDRCGIAGVCRAWLLRQGCAREQRLTPAAVEAAEAMFLCNSVRGILPVHSLAGRVLAPHPEVHALIRRLAEAEPAFAIPEGG